MFDMYLHKLMVVKCNYQIIGNDNYIQTKNTKK